MPDVAYVNGWIGPLEEARIAALDRGFLFGDAVYEVVRAYGGVPFELAAHLRRLGRSLRGVGMRWPLPAARMRLLVEDLLQRSGHREARIYLQVSRGVGRRQHTFPRRTPPTLVVFVEALPNPVSAARRRTGLRAITHPDERWGRCDLKATVLLPNVLAREAARRAGADEAILVGPGGRVREGAGSNVFVVRGRTLRTHPLGPAILPGVSRAIVLDLARRDGLRVREDVFTVRGLYGAEEVMLASTVMEIAPVVRVDGRPIGDGRPGPVAGRLHEAFRARVAAHLRRRHRRN